MKATPTINIFKFFNSNFKNFENFLIKLNISFTDLSFTLREISPILNFKLFFCAVFEYISGSFVKQYPPTPGLGEGIWFRCIRYLQNLLSQMH